ncbi:hypothetical protein LTR17_018365 [Elasticomyces elasticus]|nr:hypothetical protein LTR17_018365 [Elasticomyces elasticus]
MAYSKRVVAAQQAKEMDSRNPTPPLLSSTAAQKQGPNKLRKKSGYVPSHDIEVLFDVEDDAQDDSGEFEAGSSAADESKFGVSKTELPAVP